LQSQQAAAAPVSMAGMAAPAPVPQPQQQSPEAMQMLMNAYNSQNQIRQAAEQRHNDVMNSPLQYQPPQQSPFEQAMQQQVQQHMMNLLSDKKTPLERFTKGMRTGQMIADNIVLPIVDGFSRSGGMGHARALAQLQARDDASEANERALGEQRNQAIARLASIYENISPTSSKYLSQIASHQLQAQQYNRQAENEAYKDLLSATTGTTQAAGKLFDASLGAAKEQNDLLFKGHAAANDNARLQNSATSEASQMDARNKEYGEGGFKDKSLGLQQRSVENAEASTKQRGDQYTTVNNAKADEEKAKAAAQVKQIVTGLRNSAQQPGLIPGTYKFPDALNRFANDKASREVLDYNLKKSGSNLTSDDVIKGLTPQASPQAAKSDNPLDSIGNFLMGGVNNMTGKKDVLPGGAPPTPKAADQAKAPGIKMSPKQAHDGFVAKYGRQPNSAKELMDFAGGN